MEQKNQTRKVQVCEIVFLMVLYNLLWIPCQIVTCHFIEDGHIFISRSTLVACGSQSNMHCWATIVARGSQRVNDNVTLAITMEHQTLLHQTFKSM